jgi:hypothetical protein
MLELIIILIPFVLAVIFDILHFIFIKEKEKIPFPNIKIWGLGVILSVFILFAYIIIEFTHQIFSPFLKDLKEYEPSALKVILGWETFFKIAVLLFVSFFLFIIVWAIVRIVKED